MIGTENLNVPAIRHGKLRESDLSHHACTANACRSGRDDCPVPMACLVSQLELDEISWRWVAVLAFVVSLLWLGVVWMAVT